MSTDPETAATGTEEAGNDSAWAKERDRIKTLWVVSVAFFWFSLFFQGALYYLDGQVNIVLLSIIAGMLILGVVLKIRLQLHLRKKP